MSKPTQMEIEILKAGEGDDEAYHGYFDDLLESKLRILDPEWMEAMKAIYEASGMSRWTA